MTRGTHCAVAVAVLTGALLTACVEQKETLVLSGKSPVELRTMQSRVYETGDRNKIYKAVISMLQDLGYAIVRVEPEVGSVSANKLRTLRLSAAVYPRSENRTVVRANAVVRLDPSLLEEHQVDSPEFYQQRFFEPLSKAVFLTALQIEDPADESIPEIKMEVPVEKKDETGGKDGNKGNKTPQ